MDQIGHRAVRTVKTDKTADRISNLGTRTTAMDTGMVRITTTTTTRTARRLVGSLRRHLVSQGSKGSAQDSLPRHLRLMLVVVAGTTRGTTTTILLPLPRSNMEGRTDIKGINPGLLRHRRDKTVTTTTDRLMTAETTGIIGIGGIAVVVEVVAVVVTTDRVVVTDGVAITVQDRRIVSKGH